MKWRELNQGSATRLGEMRKADPYALFGVTRATDLLEIKRAYREMIRTYHPDKADPFMRSTCNEALKIINAAMARIEREQKHDSEG